MSLELHTPNGSTLPPSDSLRMHCHQCGRGVRIHVARAFVRAIQQLQAVAGVAIPGDIPALTYRCEGGHIVVIPVEKFGLAS